MVVHDLPWPINDNNVSRTPLAVCIGPETEEETSVIRSSLEMVTGGSGSEAALGDFGKDGVGVCDCTHAESESSVAMRTGQIAAKTVALSMYWLRGNGLLERLGARVMRRHRNKRNVKAEYSARSFRIGRGRLAPSKTKARKWSLKWFLEEGTAWGPFRENPFNSVLCRLQGRYLERVMGIEPTLAAWEAAVLPLNYTRGRAQFSGCDGLREPGAARAGAPLHQNFLGIRTSCRRSRTGWRRCLRPAQW
jgi:hypothetical protein